MKKLNYIFPAIIVVTGIFFRFFRLTEVPPPLSHDEVAIGYNAYSILKTGRDEYGNRLPLLFKSFDDYKLPGMVYSTIVPVYLFGLNELGVRLPSAVYGYLSVIVFYFIVREFLKQAPEFKSANIPVPAAVMTGFFSFSLWHINFSRQNFESNGAVFFLMLATYFLIRFPAKPKLLIPAAVFYAVSIYFYYSVRLIIPFILTAFFVTRRIEIQKNIKYVILSLLFGLLTLIPLAPSLFSPGGFERIKIVSVTNDQNYINRLSDYAGLTAENKSLFNRIIYNRRLALAVTITENYLKNVSFEQLFVKGAGRTGLLHKFEFPLIIIGLFSLFIIKSPIKWIFIAWLFSSPLPGAFSVNQPNALRTLPGAPVAAFISGLGFISILYLYKPLKIRYFITAGLIVLYILSLTQFYDSYFRQFPYDSPLSFADGQKQMVKYIKSRAQQYSNVVISGHYWRPYIFTLFWLNYDPLDYQVNGNTSAFNKFIFGKSGWDSSGVLFSDPETDIVNLSPNPRETLYLLSPSDYNAHQSQFLIVDTIDGLYAKSAFYAAIPNLSAN